MRPANRYFDVPLPSRQSASRDITALVDAACVAGAISGVHPPLFGHARIERRLPSATRRDGWYEDGTWYEPAERRRVNAIKGLQNLKNV